MEALAMDRRKKLSMATLISISTHMAMADVRRGETRESQLRGSIEMGLKRDGRSMRSTNET